MNNLFIPANIKRDMFPVRYADRYLYLIHKVIEEHQTKDLEPEQFAPLNSKTLGGVLGSSVTPLLLQELTETNVLECDNNYIIGKRDNKRNYIGGGKSRGYRLAEAFRHVKNRAELIQDKKLRARLEAHRQNQRVINGLYSWLQEPLKRVTINKKAYEFVNDTFENNTHKWNCYTGAINRIEQHPEIPFTPDETSGRIHTNITVMSRQLRHFLGIRGEERRILNIDIANAQPFFFNPMIKDYTNEMFERDYILTATNIYGESYDVDLNDELYNSNLSTNDVKLFEYLTSEGIFYEFIMERMNYTGDRTEFKKKFFASVFFCEPSQVTKERKVLDAYFPIVSGAIDYYKKPDFSTLSEAEQEKPFAQLAIKLQRQERKIMIDTIAKKAISENPNMFLASIHDSFLVTEGNENYISNLIKQEFNTKYSLQPKIKIEYL